MTVDDPSGPNRAWGALGLAIRLAQTVCSAMRSQNPYLFYIIPRPVYVRLCDPHVLVSSH
jgi:hypothetical protein